ncbi:hypothetical protein HAX54_048229 [Datura stramonium]|uniref:Uncharacterized protein n=1 Tax=Datura stramonium TaxID=4076 RepID=A0ABS8STG1_DATST|nr:hypothetical protein [Datura stramonium]
MATRRHICARTCAATRDGDQEPRGARDAILAHALVRCNPSVFIKMRKKSNPSAKWIKVAKIQSREEARLDIRRGDDALCCLGGENRDKTPRHHGHNVIWNVLFEENMNRKKLVVRSRYSTSRCRLILSLTSQSTIMQLLSLKGLLNGFTSW